MQICFKHEISNRTQYFYMIDIYKFWSNQIFICEEFRFSSIFLNIFFSFFFFVQSNFKAIWLNLNFFGDFSLRFSFCIFVITWFFQKFIGVIFFLRKFLDVISFESFSMWFLLKISRFFHKKRTNHILDVKTHSFLNKNGCLI